jgi:hypothetical protein
MTFDKKTETKLEAAAKESTSNNYLSPISPSRLFDLYFKPKQYFTNIRQLDDSFAIIICALVMGIATSMNSVGQLISTLGAFNSIPLIQEQYLMLIDGWGNYWQSAFISGVVYAVLLWLTGGWWYEVRLRFCKAKEVDLDDARRLYVIQEFVCSAPFVIMGVLQFFMYANYAQVVQSKTIWISIALFFVIWSCWTSYTAATTAYQLSKIKAMLFFLLMPMAFYIAVFIFQLQQFDTMQDILNSALREQMLLINP